MRKRYANHRRVKIHRSYTVEEIARLFGAHKNTVRAWVKAGLPTCDRKRPTLILGRDLAAFLQERRAKRKQPCRLGEIYCVRCRSPKKPAGNLVDYEPVTDKIGNLTAICPDCDSIMNRRVSVAKLGSVQEKMEITFPQALPRFSEEQIIAILKESEAGVGTEESRVGQQRGLLAAGNWAGFGQS